MREQGDRPPPDLSELNEPPPDGELGQGGLEELAKLPPSLWNQRLKRISEVLAVPAAILLFASAVFSIRFSISVLGGQPVEPPAKAVESQAAVSPTPKPSPLEQVLKEKPTLISDFKNSQPNLSDEQAMALLGLYIDDGAKFRRQVLYAQLTGGEQSVIQSYFFLKNALGFETSEVGQPHQVDEYKVGDVVRVTDFNKPPGIFLRQTPTLDANPQDLFTYDGNSLMILKGPEDILGEDKKEAWRMWWVRKVSFCGPSGWQPTCYEGIVIVPEEGWVWQGWFGGRY